MQSISRMLINLCSEDLERSKTFYTQLFSFDLQFDSDWFVQLVAKGTALELGIIDRQNDLVPPEFRQAPTGCYLTLVVKNVDSIYEQAQAMGVSIVAPPQNTFYGQRRLLLKDPDGTLVDVSAPAGPPPDLQ